MACEKASELELAERYVLGQLEDNSRQTFEQHYFECSDCQNTLRTLVALQAELCERPHERRRPRVASSGSWRQWMAIAAAVLVVPSALLYFRSIAGRDDPIAIAALSDEQAPRDYRDFMRRALASGTVELPPNIDSLRGQFSAQRGGTGAAAHLTVVSPVGTAVLSQTPKFTWETNERADGYMVEVYASGFLEIARSPRIHATEWICDTPLARGGTYEWVLTAYAGREHYRVPAPPLPPARFFVVGTETARELDEAARRHPEAHLLLGLLYARAGVLDQARNQLQLASDAHPGSAAVQKLTNRIEELSQRPTSTKPAQ